MQCSLYKVTRKHIYFGRAEGVFYCYSNLQKCLSYHSNVAEGDTSQDEQK
jgi:hypothetical protein